MQALFLLLFSMFLMQTDQQVKKKIIFFGDSITQAAVKPGGYIDVLNKTLEANNNTSYELVGAGIGGNKVYDLYLRAEEDVINKKPAIVLIYVGVNDVWHKRTSGTGTDADKFEKFYRALVKKIQAGGAKVAVCTPAAIGERNDHTNELDGDLNKFSQIIRNMAKDLNLPLVDLRKKFTAYAVANNPKNEDRNILTTDGVHLNEKGNQLVAEAIWSVLSTM